MGEAPEPFVPADTDLTDFDSFVLNVERLMASELVASSTPEECWAALMLWCRCWKQVPAGSLPNDDKILASFSGAGKRWSKIKGNALHGFVLCSDGRLYHRFLCAEVLRAFSKKKTYQARRDKDAERLRKWREEHGRNDTETRFDAACETRFVAVDSTVQVQYQDSTVQEDPYGSSTVSVPVTRSGGRARKALAAPSAPNTIKTNGNSEPEGPPDLTRYAHFFAEIEAEKAEKEQAERAANGEQSH